MVTNIISLILMIIGFIFVSIAVFGLFRFRYALNRMHSAAICDTLGILFVLSGCMVRWGFSFATLKCLVVIIFLWLTSPVASHLIANLDVITNEVVRKELEEKE